jgi:hypothetical protein
MNFSHEHQDSGQQEWWSAWQSTLFPVVVYRRVPRWEGDTTGVVVAESRVYISPDLNHSNAFVKHVTEDSIRHYQPVFAAAGQNLAHVHLWSDGCRGQFKNKEQFLWLASGTTFAQPPSSTDEATASSSDYGRIRLAHHFFQSCHGKGPSDSEGAAVKCSLRQHELLDCYYATTDEAYEWLQNHRIKVAPEYPVAGRPQHSIHKRSFHLVPFGTVDHFCGPESAPLFTKTNSKFCFDSASNEPSQLGISELSGDFCPACFRGDLVECNSRVDLTFEHMTMMNTGSGATLHAAASRHLRDRALSLLESYTPGDHAFVMFGIGVDALSPVELVDGKVRQGSIAIYCAYDTAADGTLVLNENTLCSRKLENCGGLHAVPSCFKRHIQQVKLTSLRPPLFSMVETPKPRAASRQQAALRQRAAPRKSQSSLSTSRERHSFCLPQNALDDARAAVFDDEKVHAPALLY